MWENSQLAMTPPVLEGKASLLAPDLYRGVSYLLPWHICLSPGLCPIEANEESSFLYISGWMVASHPVVSMSSRKTDLFIPIPPLLGRVRIFFFVF